jgi:signal transduction histidine kinase
VTPAQREALDQALAEAGPAWSQRLLGMYPDSRGVPLDFIVSLRRGGSGWMLIAEPAQAAVSAVNDWLLALNDELTRAQRQINQQNAALAQHNDRLRELDELKDVLLANVSHDLRTPLTMIAGFSQALLDGTVRQHEARSSAEVIHEEAGKMQQLVDDLLQLTRLESGLLKLDRHPVALRGFVQHILDRIERAATGESHAVLRNEVAEDLPHVDVDPVQLERSLRNLLTNALEYTPPSGGITVGAARLNRQWIEVTVADTGCGIPDDDVPRIFERFYRSDRSRERAHGHSGLGLAIVREIVEAHGGHVSVDTRPERGTTFRLSLPVASPAAARRATAASETADVLGS